MFSHPASVTGAVVMTLSGLFLLFGVASGAEVLGRSIVNVHSISIAQSSILIGCTLFLAGILTKATETIKEFLVGHPEMTRNLNELRELRHLNARPMLPEADRQRRDALVARRKDIFG